MKIIKTIIVFLAGLTVGEFLMQWRLNPEPVTLKQSAKDYVKETVEGLKLLPEMANAESWEIDAKLQVLMFPNRKR